MTKPISDKPHYAILDGLRGVAALIVVAFHIFEAHATSRFDLLLNHGYLAVDFFFLLSGFVIGYAYDDRWDNITLWDFLKRRLLRLQPMVIISMIIGALLFYFQKSNLFPLIQDVTLNQLILTMIIGATLIPIPPSMDIRGWIEMHPLNGPAWSLFFEYVANVLYATVIRRFNNIALCMLVVLSAGALLHLTIKGPQGDVMGGWSLHPDQLYIGCVRVMFPFFAGLLLSRTIKLFYVKNAFLWCSVLLIVCLSWPRVGGPETLWMNALYESFAIIILFPAIIFLGAGGEIKQAFVRKLCKFLGEISYPVYITHYPFIYIYFAWVKDNNVTLQDAYPVAVGTFCACMLLAYVCLKTYDEPVRSWFTQKLVLKSKAS